MNFDTWKQYKSLDSFYFNVNPFSLPNRSKVPITCWWRFQYWSRFCSGFHRSYLFLLDRHGFSDKFVNTVHNSNPRFGLIFKQRLNLDFNTASSVFIANFYVRDWAKIVHCFGSILLYEFLFDLEATYILGIKIDFLLLVVTEEHRRIAQLRQRSIALITSGLLIISQIVARILAPGFPVALHWLAILREEIV